PVELPGQDVLLLRRRLQAGIRSRAREVPEGVIEPPLLRGRARYERAMHGWVDSLHADAFTHTVRLREPDREIELILVALPSPTYLIRDERCPALIGTLAPAVIRAL